MLRRAKIKVAHFEHDLVDQVEVLNKEFSDQYPIEERLKALAAAREVGPNGFRIGLDEENNRVEWIQEKDDPEPWPLILRRSDDAISEMYQECWDKVWWNRHMVYSHDYGREECTGKGKLGCDGAARVEKKYGRENLGWDDVDWGILQGKLSALSWVMGSEWEESLDT
jgi:hypothetical protein